MIVEVVCSNLESVTNASVAGAHRIELCCALSVGGLTPSLAFVESAVKIFPTGVFVLVRPREGNFVYNTEEFRQMLRDISLIKSAGAAGIVSGILTATNKIDRERTTLLIEAASPLPFTFHRAFDLISDPISGLETLKEIGAKRVLTSGQKNTAEEGMELIKKLRVISNNDPIILAGSGINPNNAQLIVNYTGVSEIHFSAKKKIENNNSIALGSSDDGSYEVSDMRTIKLIIAELQMK